MLLPSAGEEACFPKNPGCWPNCCFLLSVGTFHGSLSIGSPFILLQEEGGKCSLSISCLVFCSSLHCPPVWDPKRFLVPELPLRALVWGLIPCPAPGLAPLLFGSVPGCHHCPILSARMDGGVGFWGLASWCQAFGAKASKGPRAVLPPPPVLRAGALAMRVSPHGRTAFNLKD